MSNTLVAQFRKFRPETTKGLSDDQITLLLGDESPDLLQADPEFHDAYRKLRPGDIGKETGAAFNALVRDDVPRMAAGFGALAVDTLAMDDPLAPALGLTAAGDALRGYAKQQGEEAARRIAEAGGPTVSRVEDIRGPRDALLWALPGLARTLPLSLAQMGAAAVAERVAPGTGGSVLGALNVGQELGDIYSDVGNDPTLERGRAIGSTLMYGLPAAALDTLGEALPMAHVLPGGRVVRALGSGGVEAATEGGQTALEIQAGVAAGRAAPTDEELRSQLLNAAALGGLAGGGQSLVFDHGGGGAAEVASSEQRVAGRSETGNLRPETGAPEPVVVNTPTEVGSELGDQQPAGLGDGTYGTEGTNAVPEITPSTPADFVPAPGGVDLSSPEQPVPAGVEALPEGVRSQEPVASRPEAAPFPLVSQFNAKGLPDRVKGDPRGRDDKFGVVLVKDGVAYGRRVFKSGGKVVVQDADELLPRKAKSANRSLVDLETAGYEVLHAPFQFSQAAPDFKVTAAPADFDRWMGQSMARKQAVREAIREGTQGDVILKTISDADADTAVALMAVQDVAQTESGGSLAHTLLGLTERVDSNAKGDRAGARATAKLAAAQKDPTALLWKKNGKIFGLFDAESWAGVKELASLGDPEGVRRIVLDAVRRKGDTDDKAALRLKDWAANVTQEGARKQAGDAAYRGKGAGVAQAVDVSMTGTDDQSLMETLSDPAAQAEVARLADTPLSSQGDVSTPQQLRARLAELGVDEDAQSAAIEEMLSYDELEQGDIADILMHDPALAGFRTGLMRDGVDSARARTEQVISTLLSLHEKARTGTGDLRAPDLREGSRGEGEGVSGAEGETAGTGQEAEGLSDDQLRASLPLVPGTGRFVPDSVEAVRLNGGVLNEQSGTGGGARVALVAEPAQGRADDPVAKAESFSWFRAQDHGEAAAAKLGAGYRSETLEAAKQAAGGKALPSPIRTEMRGDGQITLVINERLHDVLWNETLDGEAVRKWHDALVAEEIIHVAQLRSLHERWQKLPPKTRGVFGEFIRTEMNRTLTEIRDSLVKLNAADREAARGALVTAWQIYFGNVQPEAFKPEELLAKLTDPALVQTVVQGGATPFLLEFGRQLVQMKRRGVVSEVSMIRKIVGTIRGWVMQGLTHLRRTVGLAESGGLGASMAELMRRTEEILDGAADGTSLTVSGAVEEPMPTAVLGGALRGSLGGVGDVADPAQLVNTDLAAINHAIGLEAKLAPVLSKLGRSLEWFRSEFGFADPQEIKTHALMQSGAGGASITGVNPGQTLDDFASRQLSHEAALAAHQAVVRKARALGKAIQQDETDIARETRRLAKVQKEATEAHRDYLNADGLADILRKGVARMIVTMERSAGRIGQQRGEILQLVKQLDARADELIDRDYAGVFAKLARNSALRSRNLFDLLDTMVNQMSLDLKERTIVEIRQAVAEKAAANPDRAELGLLIQNTPESRALLATLVAYAKTNERMLIQIERRRVKTAEERVRLADELEKLRSQQPLIKDALRGLKRSATLEERARVAYREAARLLRAKQDAIKEAQARVDAARAVLPLLGAEARRLAERDGLVIPRIGYADGMALHVPPKADAATDEVEAAVMTLNLSGEVTPRAEIDRALTRYQAFIAAREAQAAYNPDAKDATYLRAVAEKQALEQGYFAETRRKVDAVSGTLFLQPVTRAMEALGIPAGRLVSQLVSAYSATLKRLDPMIERNGRKVEQRRREFMALLAPGKVKGLSRLAREQFDALFFQPAAHAWNVEKSLLETHTVEQADRRLAQRMVNGWLANPMTERWVRGKEEAVQEALIRYITAESEASKALNDENEKAGLGVRDSGLLVQLPDGSWTEGIRESLPQGVRTISRRQNREVVPILVDAMRRAGWSGFGTAITQAAEVYEAEGADGLRELLASFFPKAVTARFVKDMASTEVRAMFDAPVQTGDFQPEADPSLVRAAWAQAGGDVVAFLEQVHALHGGGGNLAAYLQSQLERMGETWTQLAEANPTPGEATLQSVAAMTRGLMLDARTRDRWPQAWQEYASFDRQAGHGLAQRLAAQIAYGRDNERLDAALTAAEADVRRELEEYRRWEREAMELIGGAVRPVGGAAIDTARAFTGAEIPGLYNKVEKAVRDRFMAKLGEQKGRLEYRRLRDLAQRERIPGRARGDLISLFNRNEDPWAFSSALGGFLGNGALNQFGTAIMQFAEVLSPVMAWGLNRHTAAEVTAALRYLGEDYVGSIMEALRLGAHVNQSDESRAYRRLRGQDAGATAKFLDIVEGETGVVTKFLRAVPALQQLPIGSGKRFTALRPLAPFTQANHALQAAMTQTTWRRAGDMVGKVVAFYRANPAARRDPAFKIDAAKLGLTGYEAATFDKMATLMADSFALRIEEMARGAMQRAETGNLKPEAGRSGPSGLRSQVSGLTSDGLLTDRERGLLMGLALEKITLDATPATMPTGSFTNPVLRLMLPLWGWPIRRALQVARVGTDAKGRASGQALMHGLAGLAVMSLGGLAFAVLREEYDEEILRKARNTRSAKALAGLIAQGELGEAFKTFAEVTNRVGTLGAWGEVGQTIIGLGQSDAKPFSLDQRVLMANSVLSLARATSNLIAQEGTMDYAGVIRPFASAAGGNSVLHYMELINSAGEAAGTGALFGAEEQFVRRVNATNYLRVAGRSAGLEVRTGQSGAVTPSPMTPQMTRMVMAAYGNDRAGFIAAWREAVKVARAEGKPDPATYVRDSFSARHPLRTVFRSLSEGEYRTLLTRLPAGGRRDVEQAVRYYNGYAESLGAKPYSGRVGRK